MELSRNLLPSLPASTLGGPRNPRAVGAEVDHPVQEGDYPPAQCGERVRAQFIPVGHPPLMTGMFDRRLPRLEGSCVISARPDKRRVWRVLARSPQRAAPAPLAWQALGQLRRNWFRRTVHYPAWEPSRARDRPPSQRKRGSRVGRTTSPLVRLRMPSVRASSSIPMRSIGCHSRPASTRPSGPASSKRTAAATFAGGQRARDDLPDLPRGVPPRPAASGSSARPASPRGLEPLPLEPHGVRHHASSLGIPAHFGPSSPARWPGPA